MTLTEFLIRLAVPHNPLHFSGSLNRCVIAFAICTLVVPVFCTGLSAENGNISGFPNEKMNLTVNQPLKEYTYWEDVWPMKGGLVIGKVQGQYALEKVVILTDSGTTVCGNSTEIFCEFPAHEGKNQITITAIDTKGNKVYETRNFTVNLGLPPPPLITLFGKVTDMFEKPVPNATVTVVSVYGGISESDSTQTSENGSYRLDFVLAHQQNISVEKEGYPRKFWEKSFDNQTTEFNMHIDIDRSTPGKSDPI